MQPLLLEREAELSFLKEAIAEAEAGRGRLVFITGEAGLGKTALISHFCRHHAGGWRTLIGYCDPLATPRPLGPLLDVAPQLGEELIELLEAASAPHVVFAKTLAELTRRQTIVVFEDLHWADGGTLDLLRFLGRRIGGSQIVVICTYRDDEVGPRHPLTVALGDLSGADQVKRVALARLTRAAVREMCGGGDLDPDRVYQLTEGNPFLVTEVVSTGEEQLPATVRDAVLARAARLSPAGKRVLEAAAVLGNPSHDILMETLADADQPALAECLDHGMLVSVGEALSFRHHLARVAILDTMSKNAASALHRKAIDAIRRRGVVIGHLPELAEHAEKSGDRQAVLEFAPLAARRANSLGVHREAAAQYERALRFAGPLDLRSRAELTEACSYELYMNSRYLEAINYREEAAAIWRELGDRSKVGENELWRSRLLMRLARFEEALELGRQAIEILDGSDATDQLGWAHSNLAHIMFSLDRHEEAVSWAESALRLADECGNVEVRVHALSTKGISRLNLEHGGKEDLEESARLSREHGMEEHFLRAQANAAGAAFEHCLPKEMQRHLEEGLEVFVRLDMDELKNHFVALRGACSFLLGQWSEALTDVHLALQYRDMVPNRKILCELVIGLISARRGEMSTAALHMDRLSELVHEIPGLAMWAHLARSEVAWLIGDTLSASREADEALASYPASHNDYYHGEVFVWFRRLGGPLPAGRVWGPFSTQLSGNWQAAADEWETRGCLYHAAMALLDSTDAVAVERSLQVFQSLGADANVAIAKQKLRSLGVMKLAHGPRATTVANPFGLTRREVEVLVMMSDGLTNAQIASRLHIAAKTAENHVSAILAKVGARNRTAAAAALRIHPETAFSNSEDQHQDLEKPRGG